MTDAAVHFVQIEAVDKKTRTIYRFYGQGKWDVKDGRSWRPVNAIYIPARVLEIAAAQCSWEPPPRVLTERDIAQLCGGR